MTFTSTELWILGSALLTRHTRLVSLIEAGLDCYTDEYYEVIIMLRKLKYQFGIGFEARVFAA